MPKSGHGVTLKHRMPRFIFMKELAQPKPGQGATLFLYVIVGEGDAADISALEFRV